MKTAAASRVCAGASSSVLSTLFLLGIVVCAVVRYLCLVFTGRRHHGRADKESNPSVEAYPQTPHLSAVLADYAAVLGCKLTTHDVVTADGFVITLQHLTRNTDQTSQPLQQQQQQLQQRPPVLLIHGLMQSSGSFLTSGFKSIAYHLLDSGFDVWLGNNRCGFSPKHITYSRFDQRMWDWDVNEMAHYDIPAMIDEVHSLRNDTTKVSLVAHSQGTTQCVYMMSKQHRSSHLHHVNKVVLLAPAVYGGPLLNKKFFIMFMRGLPSPIYTCFFGTTSFITVMMLLRSFTYKLPFYGKFAYIIFNYLFQWDDKLWDPKLLQHHFMFSPVYVSVKLMHWWLQGKGFSEGKPIIKDAAKWFDEESPELFAVVGGDDNLVDGKMFLHRLETVEREMSGRWDAVVVEGYSHLDVLWADDVVETIGHRMVEFLGA